MRINPQPPKNWKDLQNQAALILSECGFKAEVEKTINLVRGTVNVDVYAVDETQTPQTVYICECKRWASAVPKNVVHGFRTVLSDCGANWGLIISKAGFQGGAVEAAEFSNVRLMTWEQFEELWMNRWIEKHLRPTLYKAQDRICDYTEPFIGSKLARRLDVISPERQQQFIALRSDPAKVLPAFAALHLGATWNATLGISKIDLPLNEHKEKWNLQHFPERLCATDSLREFLDVFLEWIAEAAGEFEAILDGK